VTGIKTTANYYWVKKDLHLGPILSSMDFSPVIMELDYPVSKKL
jgi:hypothetical protein